jgi:hypothetical protein
MNVVIVNSVRVGKLVILPAVKGRFFVLFGLVEMPPVVKWLDVLHDRLLVFPQRNLIEKPQLHAGDSHD